ncbi:hypothetical protein AAVH_07204 [Aphelenchoides avenae]|nr:hypothetical protein AAVH_07204 [Aphelenchus avenae]
MMVMLRTQSPGMFDKIKRLERSFNETIGALPADAQELANEMIDDLKIFDGILPEQVNPLRIARSASDAIGVFLNLTTEGSQAFAESFPRVTAVIEDNAFRKLIQLIAEETRSQFGVYFWDALD